MATETQVGAAAPDLTPRPEHKFTFGLWTVGHKGNDPFGEATRPGLDPSETVRRLADLCAYGVCFHDNDLIPLGTEPGERERILSSFRKALGETGMKVSMATTNLFADPVFKDGAFCCEYVLDRGYDMRFGIEPKPNEPRGDIFQPTVGHALAFIERLAHPEMVGVNPEVAHETMAGLSFLHGVVQALWAGKLFHIDLNGQRIGRYDQDFRFGAVGLKDGLFLVKLLEDSGYDGVRRFDPRPLRVESEEGIWDFASGCMRTYRALAAAAERFDADPDVQEALAAASVAELGESTVGGDDAETLKAEVDGLDALAARGYGNERLDQLAVEVLLGVR